MIDGLAMEQELRTSDVAQLLKISERAVRYVKIRSKDTPYPMPATKVGRLVRFHAGDVIEWWRHYKTYCEAHGITLTPRNSERNNKGENHGNV